MPNPTFKPSDDTEQGHQDYKNWLNESTRYKETETHLVQTIKVLVEKGDKAKEKSDQFYVAAGQHLKTLHAIHKERNGTWTEWETLLKERCGIAKSRASDLMLIADGTKTIDQVRERANKSAKAAQQEKRRRQISPLISGESRTLAALPATEVPKVDDASAKITMAWVDELENEVSRRDIQIVELKSEIAELKAARASERPDVKTAAEIVEANFDEFIKVMPRGLREKLERKVRAQKNGGDGDIDPNTTITRMLQEAMSCAVAAEDPNTDPDGAVAKSNRASAQKFLRDTERKLRAMGFVRSNLICGIDPDAKPKRPPTAGNADETAIAAAADTTTTVH
jgi:hypothetical protein